MKYFLLIFIFFGSTHSSNAQWYNVNVGTTDNLYSVDYFSANDIWIGSFARFVRTGNNGASWTVVDLIDQFNISMLGDMMDVEMTSSTSAIATGFFYLGNVQVIYTTNNNGASWNLIHNDTTGHYPEQLNSIDRNGSVCIAVGSSGRIVRSVNLGTTWTIVPSGLSIYAMLNDVKFINSSTLIAVGPNYILRSVDAGQTWTGSSFQGQFISVSCALNCIYLGVENPNILFKSIDNGQSVTSIQLPFSYDGIVHAISADTVLVSGVDGLYVSFNGGAAWEKYILNGYKEINKMDFINSSDGIAIGDSGYVIRTNTLSSNPSLPVVAFSIPSLPHYCLNDTVTFVNSTANLPGYTFSWKFDSIQFSTQYNGSKVLSNAGTHTITLTVTNHYGSSSFSKPITIAGHEPLPFLLQGTPPIVCSGNRAVLTIPNSQPNISYRLRSGFTNIGNAQIGNGNALTFISSSGITSATNFNVIAIGSNSCFTDSIVNPIMINSTTGGPKTACIPLNGVNTFGITNVSFNTIHNPTPANSGYYNNYACNLNTNVIPGNSYPITITTNLPGSCAVWIDFDTSGSFSQADFQFGEQFYNPPLTKTITIPSTVHIFNVPIRMRVGFDHGNFWPVAGVYECGRDVGEYEDYSITVINAQVPPTSTFAFTTATVCTTTVTFTNSSFNANNYFWDFGDGYTSTLYQPTHGYSSSGVYTVKLITTNSYGSDTSAQTVTIHNPSVPIAASCIPTLTTQSCGRIMISVLQIPDVHFSVGSFSQAFMQDFTCTKQAHLVSDSIYSAVIQLHELGGGCQGVCAFWIDWNNDGIFNDTLERIGSNIITGCPTIWVPFQVPSTAVMNVVLRARLISDRVIVGNSCSTVCGQFLDFSVVVHALPLVEINFTSNTTISCAPSTVSFSNTTTNAVSYFWDFGDGTNSSVANPTHTYTTPGIYSVKQIACNGIGECDSLTRLDYINIVPLQFTSNVQICTGQSLTISSHTYNTAGTYVDTLTSLMGCDSILTTNLTLHPGSPISISSSPCRGDSLVLSSSPGLSSWQWYRGNYPIPSATDSSIVVKYYGSYRCMGFDSTLCSHFSNVIYVAFPCQVPYPGNGNGKNNMLGEDVNENIKVFPNPGTGIFNLQSSEGMLEVYCYTGSIIYRKQLQAGNSQIDLTNFEDGIYMFTILTKDSKFLRRVILSRP